MNYTIIFFTLAAVVLSGALYPLIRKFISNTDTSMSSAQSQEKWSYIKPTILFALLVINHLSFMVLTTWSRAIEVNVSLDDALNVVSDSISNHLMVSVITFGLIYGFYMLISVAANGHIKSKRLNDIASNF